MNTHIMTSADLKFNLHYSSAAKRDEYRGVFGAGMPETEMRYSALDAGTYTGASCASKQARFKDKIVFVPTLRLKKNFSVKAVIDRLIITLVTTNVTSAQGMQSALSQVSDAKCYVGDLNNWHNPIQWRGTIEFPVAAEQIDGPGRVFAIVVQEPTPKIMNSLVEVIRDRWGINGAVQLFLLELALDFHVRKAHDPQTRVMLREQMVGLLQRHFHCLDVGFQLARSDARQVYEELDANGTKKKTTSLLFANPKGKPRRKPDSSVAVNDVQDRLKRPITNKLNIDATIYAGDERENLLFRIQHKISDSRNRRTGAFTSLTDNQRRARIEVEISGTERLGKEFGLNELDDLKGFDFRKIRNSYLSFWLPTASKDLSQQLTPRKLLEERGMYGVELIKRLERRKSREAGDKGIRRGVGGTEERVAWTECNERVGNALDALKRKWAAHKTA